MPNAFRKVLLPAGFVLAMAGAGLAQQAQLATGGFRQDTSLPVEVTSDTLTVNQTGGTATFTGNVLVVQGEMRLTSAELLVEYSADGKGISRLLAKGGVTIVSPTDAAEAKEAIYTLTPGTLELTGDVLLTQGTGAISGEHLTVDMASGTGRMDGRVRTVFKPNAATTPETKKK